MNKKKIILFDLPTYPKGVLPLSLLSVASCLKNDFDVEITDLNFESFSIEQFKAHSYVLIGMKVSSQNSKIAIELTRQIKSAHKNIQVMWGGEFATLMPDECLLFADSIICGPFERLATRFISDLLNNNLQRIYISESNYLMDIVPAPDFSLVKNISNYSSYMGLPMETSRGCTEKCVFCMVHVMQKKNYLLKSVNQLEKEVSAYKNHFINIIDYNFGVDKEHVMKAAEIIKKSGALGWMAEMCIEFLDDDALLDAMSASGCKMIYCGLESIDDVALQSVHKMNTNHVENYERIIRKAQSHGIQIAAGVILGMANTGETTFQKTLDFFQRMGVIYAKLTFLTYNPGTKVQKYMEKKGEFTTQQTEEFDGVRMSYLPYGVKREVVISGAEYFIKNFYSISSIIKRARNTPSNVSGKIEFILFSFCYSHVYRQWIDNNFLRQPEEFQKLLLDKFKKPVAIKIAEKALFLIRKIRSRRMTLTT